MEEKRSLSNGEEETCKPFEEAITEKLRERENAQTSKLFERTVNTRGDI